MVTIENTLLMYGGTLNSGPEYPTGGTVFALDLAAPGAQWTAIEPTNTDASQVPDSLAGICMLGLPGASGAPGHIPDGKIIVIGGAQNAVYNTATFVFDLALRRWSALDAALLPSSVGVPGFDFTSCVWVEVGPPNITPLPTATPPAAGTAAPPGGSEVPPAIIAREFQPAIMQIGGVFAQPVTSEPVDGGVRLLHPVCNAGTFTNGQNFSAPCHPCAAGTYSSQPASIACTACPGDSYTAVEGAISIEQCSVPQPGYCKHGTAKLSPGSFSATCDCHTGYLASDRCSFPWIIVLGVLAGLAGAVVLMLVGRLALRRMRTLRSQQELSERLLGESREEMDMLVQTFLIPVDDVQLGRLLDSGAYGDVYIGEYHGHAVAVKRLKSHLLELDPRVMEEFEREVSVMRRLRHRNLVFFYGAGADDGTPFLVTDLCEKGSLAKMLRGVSRLAAGSPAELARLGLAWSERLRFMLDAARGLAYLHAQGSVHRDVKPHNMLITRDNVLKIADFGTARLAAAGAGTGLRQAEADTLASVRGGGGAAGAAGGGGLQLTTMVGTAVYLAPEIWRGAADYTHKVDVFSFAIVLWEVLHLAQDPYAGRSYLSEIEQLVCAGQRPQVVPGSASAGGPGEELYVQLMQACWQDMPAQRPEFSDVCSVLEALCGRAGGGA